MLMLMMLGLRLDNDPSSGEGEETSNFFAITKTSRENSGWLGRDGRLAVGVAHDFLDAIPVNEVLLRSDSERVLE